MSFIAEVRIQLVPTKEYESKQNDVPVIQQSNTTHEDAVKIRERLLEATTEGQMRIIIFKWFGRYFGEETITQLIVV